MKSFSRTCRPFAIRCSAQIGHRGDADRDQIRVVVGMATCGIAGGARPVLTAFVEEVAKTQPDKMSPSPRPAASASASMSPWWRCCDPGQEKVTYVKMTPEKAVQCGQRPPGQRQRGHGIHHRRAIDKKEENQICIVPMYWSAAVPAVPPPAANKIIAEFERRDQGQGLGRTRSRWSSTGCFGLCALGPIMIVYPEGAFYSMVKRRGRSGDRVRASAQGTNRQAPAVSGDRARG